MKRNKLRMNPAVKNVMMGILVGFSVVLAGALVGAYMICSGAMDMEGVGYISATVILAAALLSSLVGSKGTAGKDRMISALAASVGFWAFLLLCNILLFDGGFHGVGVTLLVILGCGLSVFLLFGKAKTGKKYRIPKI